MSTQQLTGEFIKISCHSMKSIIWNVKLTIEVIMCYFYQAILEWRHAEEKFLRISNIDSGTFNTL